MQVNRESWAGPVLLLLGVPLIFIITMIFMLINLSGDVLGLGVLIIIIIFLNYLQLTYNYMEAWL